MRVYTYSEARQQLAALLNAARREGEVRIRRRDGQVFILRPARAAQASPLDVPGVNVRATTQDVLRAIRESRRSGEKFIRAAAAAARRRPARRRRSAPAPAKEWPRLPRTRAPA